MPRQCAVNVSVNGVHASHEALSGDTIIANDGASVSMPQDHWLPGFNFNVEEWDAKGLTYETLAICRSRALARAAFAAANRREARRPIHDPQPHARVVQPHPEGDW